MPLDQPLPPPVVEGLVPSLDEEHADVLAWLREEYAWDLADADASNPAWRLTRLLAYRAVLLRRAVADSISQVSLDYASGAILDHLGRTYYRTPRAADEADDVYRRRLLAAPGLVAVGLTAPWYESQARAVEGVASAFVVGAARPDEPAGTTPGAVTLAIRGDAAVNGGDPSAAVLDAVQARVTARDVRQQTDKVSVVPAWRVPYDVTVTLTLRPGADAAVVRAGAEAAVDRLCGAADVVGGEISAALVAGAVVDPFKASRAVVSLREVRGTRAEAAIQGVAVAAVAATGGTAISVRFVDPGAADRALGIAVDGTDITVSLATDGSGAPTTTGDDLVSAWRTSPARRLAAASRPDTEDAAAVLTAVGATALADPLTSRVERAVITAPPNGSLSCASRRVAVA